VNHRFTEAKRRIATENIEFTERKTIKPARTESSGQAFTNFCEFTADGRRFSQMKKGTLYH